MVSHRHPTTIAGCDSIVMMDLTIHYASAGYDSIIACDNLILNGNFYDFSGTYIDTLVNATGCDNVVTLSLTTLIHLTPMIV